MHACNLWRDSELPDLPQSRQMIGAASKLIAELNSAYDMLFDARLETGEHREIIPELRLRVTIHPRNERSWIQLMFALYRSNMRVEALSVYPEARNALLEASGIDPGPSTRRLLEQMLCEDPSLLETSISNY